MNKFLFMLFTCFCLSTTIIYANPLIDKAYHSKQSDVQVQGSAKVIKLLSDDNNGSRHQRFVLKLSSNLTISSSPKYAPHCTSISTNSFFPMLLKRCFSLTGM